MRAALHLLEQQEQEEEAKLEGLRRAATEGQDAYNRGDYVQVADDAALDQLFDDLAETESKS